MIETFDPLREHHYSQFCYLQVSWTNILTMIWRFCGTT